MQKAGIGFPASKVSAQTNFNAEFSELLFLIQGEGNSTEDGITSAMNQLEGDCDQWLRDF